MRAAIWLGLALSCAGVAAACATLRSAGPDTTQSRDSGTHEIATPGDEGGVNSPLAIVRDQPEAGALRSVWGIAANDVYLAGERGSILHYTGDPQWAEAKMGSGIDLASLWGASAPEVYAVGTI